MTATKQDESCAKLREEDQAGQLKQAVESYVMYPDDDAERVVLQHLKSYRECWMYLRKR